MCGTWPPSAKLDFRTKRICSIPHLREPITCIPTKFSFLSIYEISRKSLNAPRSCCDSTSSLQTIKPTLPTTQCRRLQILDYGTIYQIVLRYWILSLPLKIVVKLFINCIIPWLTLYLVALLIPFALYWAVCTKHYALHYTTLLSNRPIEFCYCIFTVNCWNGWAKCLSGNPPNFLYFCCVLIQVLLLCGK